MLLRGRKDPTPESDRNKTGIRRTMTSSDQDRSCSSEASQSLESTCRFPPVSRTCPETTPRPTEQTHQATRQCSRQAERGSKQQQVQVQTSGVEELQTTAGIQLLPSSSLKTSHFCPFCPVPRLIDQIVQHGQVTSSSIGQYDCKIQVEHTPGEPGGACGSRRGPRGTSAPVDRSRCSARMESSPSGTSCVGCNRCWDGPAPTGCLGARLLLAGAGQRV